MPFGTDDRRPGRLRVGPVPALRRFDPPRRRAVRPSTFGGVKVLLTGKVLQGYRRVAGILKLDPGNRSFKQAYCSGRNRLTSVARLAAPK